MYLQYDMIRYIYMHQSLSDG